MRRILSLKRAADLKYPAYVLPEYTEPASNRTVKTDMITGKERRPGSLRDIRAAAIVIVEPEKIYKSRWRTINPGNEIPVIFEWISGSLNEQISKIWKYLSAVNSEDTRTTVTIISDSIWLLTKLVTNIASPDTNINAGRQMIIGYTQKPAGYSSRINGLKSVMPIVSSITAVVIIRKQDTCPAVFPRKYSIFAHGRTLAPSSESRRQSAAPVLTAAAARNRQA
jgi:hypothetical protein